jgi:hypothetical protein
MQSEHNLTGTLLKKEGKIKRNRKLNKNTKKKEQQVQSYSISTTAKNSTKEKHDPFLCINVLL